MSKLGNAGPVSLPADALEQIDKTRILDVGGTSLTIGELVSAAVILVVTFVLARLVSRGIGRLREKSAQKSTAAIYLLQKLLGYGIVLTGVVMALSAAGLNLSSLAIFAGAIGIGVGLGLQGVVKEFVSGIFLIFDRMVSVGDYVEIDGGVRGMIVEIGPRATRIRTNDNINVLVPNSQLIEQPVTNWTLKGDTRRIHIPFSVAYGVDRGQVRDAVLEAARASPFTLPETEQRKSQVWLVGFGDSALNFELLVWPTREAVKRPAAMHAAYTWLIADALDRAQIEIPFPQTDLRIRSILGREGDEALKALGLNPAPAKPAKSAPPPLDSGVGHNDAADDLLCEPEDDAQNPVPPRTEG
jgi:Small-conductance mechanosensitive channel